MKILVRILLLFFSFAITLVQCEAASQDITVSEDASDEKEEPTQQKVKAHDFPDPFASWLPKKILDRVGDTAMRFPVRQQSQQEVAPPSLTIQGLIWNTDMPQAIVNGKIVKIGDIIDGAEVINISKEGITIRHNDKELLIKPEL